MFSWSRKCRASCQRRVGASLAEFDPIQAVAWSDSFAFAAGTFPALPCRAFTWPRLRRLGSRDARALRVRCDLRYKPATGAASLRATKENRAGWPGFFCVELDAVTSQRGATGAEGAFVLLRRVHRSKDLTGKRKPTDGWVQAACHASACIDCKSVSYCYYCT